MKILPTIGPISESIFSLKKLNKFANIFRLNGSHNNLDWHKKIIKRIKDINKKNNIHKPISQKMEEDLDVIINNIKEKFKFLCV